MSAAKAISRRVFGKFAAAAPLAAPSLASEAGPRVGYGSGLMGMGGSVPLGEAEYMRRHRMKLERIIATGRDDDDDDYQRSYGPTDHILAHYDGLVSVSPVMKRVMCNRAMQARAQVKLIDRAKLELKRLIERSVGLS